jgi:hypothetical protein
MNRAKIRLSDARTEPDVVGDDPKVVAHPNFRQVPEPIFPIRTDRGLQEYQRYARMLFDADRLTVEAHRMLSTAIFSFDRTIQAETEGRPLRASWVANYDKLMRSLKLDELENAEVARPKNSQNKFSGCGFSASRQ